MYFARIFLYFLLFFFKNYTYCADNINNSSELRNVSKSKKIGSPVVNALSRFFGFFYNFDISIRVSRIKSIYPFFWDKDGSLTLRFSFVRLFKKNAVLRHNLIFELNFLRACDLGGRGFDFLVRKFGSNILLDSENDNESSKKFAHGSYFFSILNKTAIFFSIGFEGDGIYHKIFKTDFTKCGFGFRFPIWCGGPFTLVKDLELSYNKTDYVKESGCKKWKNLGSKKPLEGFVYNILFYFKPFIYEFDNGFRIDITWETCINDYRYVFYKVKKTKNVDRNVSVYNIYSKYNNSSCFRRFLIVLENLFVLKTRIEIGLNLSKFI